MQIIWELWLRQIRRHARIRSRVFGSLAQPLVYLLALGFGFAAVFEQAGQGKYLTFLLPGVIAMCIVNTGFATGGELIWDRQFGVLRSILVSPARRIYVLAARVLGGASVSTFQGTAVFALATGSGLVSVAVTAILPALGLMFLIALLFTAFGALVAARVNDLPAFQLFLNLTIMPLFLLSGALFPLAGLPKWLEIVTRINPVSYAVDGLRGVLTQLTFNGLPTDLWVLASTTLVLFVVGAAAFARLETE